MIEEYLFLGFPLSGNEVRKIAFSFAEANGFEGFSKMHNGAGRKCFGFFLKRYPQLKVKETVTNLSIARGNATRKSSVLAWYKKYENVLKQLEIMDPKYIWNIDEHGSEDMPKMKKVISLKGFKQSQAVPETTSREAKVNHDAHLCQCCRLCIASPGNPQRQIP